MKSKIKSLTRKAFIKHVGYLLSILALPSNLLSNYKSIYKFPERKLTFDNFIIYKNNDFAFKVSLVFANLNFVFFNPLIICSDAGMGKSHLLKAIRNKKREKSQKTVFYYGEDLAIKLKNVVNRNRIMEDIAGADVIIIDDCDYLGFKKDVFSEFEKLAKKIIKKDTQLVLACSGKSEFLKQMFDEIRKTKVYPWAMKAHIGQPDINEKKSIIKSLSNDYDIKLENRTINYYSHNSNTSIRTIETKLLHDTIVKRYKQAIKL